MARGERNTAPAADAASRAPSLHLVAGRLCLDFANTTSGRHTSQNLEHLTSYSMLLAWAVHAGMLSGEAAAALAARAAQEPTRARRVLREALALRELIHRIFAALAAGDTVAEGDLDALNRRIARSLANARLEPHGTGFGWGWADAARSLDSVLWPVVRSAAETLAEGPHDRLRQCPGAACGWLFLDTSKAGHRRWCDMKVCGNRMKARRHYRRSKIGTARAALSRSPDPRPPRGTSHSTI
ncbi:MAG: ABATE domain-containing protein [Alphaproteobacteria bacterium]|nr:ABATE domain-containing protein [Alphaproteobacteria bacterium]